MTRPCDVRFGSGHPDPRGGVTVVYKSRDHISKLYHTVDAVRDVLLRRPGRHYSPDFAAVGYNGASHGCVNVRDYDGIASLFDQVRRRRQGRSLLVLSRRRAGRTARSARS